MIRKISALIVVALAATALLVGGHGSSSAAPSALSHKKFTTKVHYTAKTVSVEKLDRLDAVTNVRLTRRHLNRGGTVKGAGEFTCHRKTVGQNYEHCRGALALKQGLIYINARLPFSTFRLAGDITGGSGVYKHVVGRMSAVIGDTNHASIMTVKYRYRHKH
ncbi:MAG: hypothetical protein JO214_17315 [Frankiaceae bacterium]|nr:hypothetical protein [Frankiaceae bacterium]